MASWPYSSHAAGFDRERAQLAPMPVTENQLSSNNDASSLSITVQPAATITSAPLAFSSFGPLPVARQVAPTGSVVSVNSRSVVPAVPGQSTENGRCLGTDRCNEPRKKTEQKKFAHLVLLLKTRTGYYGPYPSGNAT